MFKQYFKTAIGNSHLNRRLNRISVPNIIVLMYHDICEDDDIRSWLRVRRSDFITQLNMFSSMGRFIHIEELNAPEIWTGQDLKILITFDDGCVNNYKLAYPILNDSRIPAIFFVSTEHISEGTPFWFDCVVTPIQVHRMNHMDLRQYNLKNYRFRNENEEGRWEDIESLLLDIKSIGNASNPNVKSIIDHIINWNPDSVSQKLMQYRPMNQKEVKEMHDTGLFHFGSHSHTHDILLYQSDEQRRHNLIRSMSFLKDILNTDIDFIAYPNGDYDESILKLCAELGFKYGFTVKAGLFQEHQNLLAIPRISVGGYDKPQDILFKINRELLKNIILK